MTSMLEKLLKWKLFDDILIISLKERWQRNKNCFALKSNFCSKNYAGNKHEKKLVKKYERAGSDWLTAVDGKYLAGTFLYHQNWRTGLSFADT